MDFDPNISPLEMLEMGVFAGNYFYIEELSLDENKLAWSKLSDELKSHLVQLNRDKYMSRDDKDASKNFYGVIASRSYTIWQEKGWIHPDHPYGWFNWYFEYWLGNRHEDDARQIRRWKQFTTRQIGMHLSLCQRYNKDFDNINSYPKYRQALLHWGVTY